MYFSRNGIVSKSKGKFRYPQRLEAILKSFCCQIPKIEKGLNRDILFLFTTIYFKSGGENTLSCFFCVGFFVGGKKMKVCFVRCLKIFVGWRFFLFFLCGCHSKRCRLLSQVFPKLFVQSTKVSSLQGANRVAGNVLQLQEVGDFEALNCLPALNLIRSTKLHLTTEPPISCRCC